jgi:hypothetical protein
MAMKAIHMDQETRGNSFIFLSLQEFERHLCWAAVHGRASFGPLGTALSGRTMQFGNAG